MGDRVQAKCRFLNNSLCPAGNEAWSFKGDFNTYHNLCNSSFTLLIYVCGVFFSSMLSALCVCPFIVQMLPSFWFLLNIVKHNSYSYCFMEHLVLEQLQKHWTKARHIQWICSLFSQMSLMNHKVYAPMENNCRRSFGLLLFLKRSYI